jgi:hypothetical protein
VAPPGTEERTAKASTAASVDAASAASGVSNLSPVPSWGVGLTGVVEEEEAMNAIKNQQKKFTAQEIEEEREIGEGDLLKLS